MIKSKVQSSYRNNPPVYPKLVYFPGDTSGTIVLLTAPKKGVVVHIDEGHIDQANDFVGRYTENWRDENMADFYGTVELTQ